MMQENGYCLVIDFNVSKIIEDGGSASTCTGTPLYRAPEIQPGRVYTNKIDWWSVGIMAYEMLVGNHPFVDNTKPFDRAQLKQLPKKQRKPVEWPDNV